MAQVDGALRAASGTPGGPPALEPFMLVEIWSDIVCPWCYIGKRRFESALARFAHSDQVEVRWRSFELDPSAPFRRPGNMADHLAAKYGMTVDEAAQRLESLNVVAAAEGLTYDLVRTKGGNTFDAHRLIHLAYEKGPATGGELKEALLRAYFVDLRAVSDPGVLLEIGVDAGLDRDEVCAVLASDRFAGEVRRDEADAAAMGCTGVPFFVFDRALAVSGAQDPETFLITLQRAWDRSRPAVETVSGGQGGICADDTCGL